MTDYIPVVLILLFVLPISAFLCFKLGALGWLKGKEKYRELRRKKKNDHERN